MSIPSIPRYEVMKVTDVAELGFQCGRHYLVSECSCTPRTPPIQMQCIRLYDILLLYDYTVKVVLLGLAHRILYDSTSTVHYTMYTPYSRISPDLPYKLVLNGYTYYDLYDFCSSRSRELAGPFHVDFSFPWACAPAPYAPHTTAPIRPPGYYP
jgi:hypothetical protein